MKVSYHENMLRSCCHDLLCKHKLFLFPMHLNNQIVIFKVPSKNFNEIDILEWETNVLET